MSRPPAPVTMAAAGRSVSTAVTGPMSPTPTGVAMSDAQHSAEYERLVEIVGHRSQQVNGYIPIDVLTEMGIDFEEGRTTWFTAEQSAAIRRHPRFEEGRTDA